VNLYQAVSETPAVANTVGMLCPWWIAKSYLSLASLVMGVVAPLPKVHE
jgi:hypothetical protein